MQRPLVLLALLLLTPIGARGDDKPAPPTPEQQAARVLEVWKGKDEGKAATLAALADVLDPDPWVVADELIGRGELDAAEAFAKARPHLGVEKLPAYVASRRGARDDPEARRALQAASAALSAGKPVEALAALPVADRATDGVLGVRIGNCRGQTLLALWRSKEGIAVHVAAADAAERIGWFEGAYRNLQRAAKESTDRADHRTALALFQRQQAFAEAVNAATGLAVVRNNIAGQLSLLGSHTKAIAMHRESLAVAEKRGDLGLAQLALDGLRNAYDRAGDYRQAQACGERALDMAQKVGDKNAEAMDGAGLATVLAELGDFSRAMKVEEAALALARQIHNPVVEAAALNGLGTLYREVGDSRKAVPIFQQALGIAERTENREGVAAALGNLGKAYEALGEGSEAIAVLERSIAMFEQAGNGSSLATVLTDLGIVHRSMKEHPKAMAAFDRALKLYEGLGDRPGMTTVLNDLGNEYMGVGDAVHATAARERALELGDEAGDPRNYVILLYSLAGDRHTNGRDAEALPLARRAAAMVPGVVRGQGDEVGAGARRRYNEIYHVGLGAAYGLKDAVASFEFLEGARAGALLESLSSRERLRAAALPPALRQAEDEAKIAERAAADAYREAIAAGDAASTAARRAEVDSARDRLGGAVERIQREAKSAADVLYPTALSLSDAQSLLADSDCLLLFSIFNGNTVSMVISKTEARPHPLGDPAEISALCAKGALAVEGSDAIEWREEFRRRVVSHLKLPLATRRLLISPDGVLSFVPFSFVIDGVDVAYVPSATTYRILLEEKAKRGDDVLALGDPDYGANPNAAAIARLRGGATLDRLPATRDEAKAVGDKVLLGREATESGLRSALGSRKRWHAVHLACHGLLDTERPGFCSLALTADAKDDGFLTALDLYEMRIPADLVVLSACETGKGQIATGEGIIGLTRAFMFAGAPRVIVSLWKVDDKATRILMEKFYALWNKQGLGAAAALKKAQEYVRDYEEEAVDSDASRAAGHDVTAKKKPYAAPRFWAGWVLWGLPD